MARLHGGAYHLCKAGNPNGPLIKFPTEAIQPCPPGLLTYSPIDAPDLQYLNMDHTPTTDPLAKPFNLKSYNEVWFSQNINAPPCKFDYSSQPDFLIDITIDERFPTIAELSKETPDNTNIPTETQPDKGIITTEDLAASIATSKDKLFFISNLMPNTLWPRWYLVQVNMECTLHDPMSQHFTTSGQYYVHFQHWHLDNVACNDLTSRWWPIWHEYTIADDTIIDYGKSVNIRPHVMPDHTKYIAWSDVVPLCSPECYLLGPVDFQTGLRHLDQSVWSQHFQICATRGIIPPTLSLQPKIRSKWSRLPLSNRNCKNTGSNIT